MPKRQDIKSILIIGAGPIVIGQACEFDYSGTQACKALKEEGYRRIAAHCIGSGIADRDIALVGRKCRLGLVLLEIFVPGVAKAAERQKFE